MADNSPTCCQSRYEQSCEYGAGGGSNERNVFVQ